MSPAPEVLARVEVSVADKYIKRVSAKGIKGVIVSKMVYELTAAEYRSCYNLNMGTKGLMRPKLMRARRTKSKTRVYMFKSNGFVHSWALVFDDSRGDLNAYFYTRVRSRRKKYGSLLASHIKSELIGFYVYPWGDVSNPSWNFFKSNNLERHR